MAQMIAPRKFSGLPPLLARLVRAIARDSRQQEQAAAGRAAALVDFARMFLILVPVHGVDPADDVRESIERIAVRHLRRGEAETQLRRAIDRVSDPKERDAIESACLEAADVGELAHYYAGIAAGITLASLSRPPR
jgi:hypothetical protein